MGGPKNYTVREPIWDPVPLHSTGSAIRLLHERWRALLTAQPPRPGMCLDQKYLKVYGNIAPNKLMGTVQFSPEFPQPEGVQNFLRSRKIYLQSETGRL